MASAIEESGSLPMSSAETTSTIDESVLLDVDRILDALADAGDDHFFDASSLRPPGPAPVQRRRPPPGIWPGGWPSAGRAPGRLLRHGAITLVLNFFTRTPPNYFLLTRNCDGSIEQPGRAMRDSLVPKDVGSGRPLAIVMHTYSRFHPAENPELPRAERHGRQCPVSRRIGLLRRKAARRCASPG